MHHYLSLPFVEVMGPTNAKMTALLTTPSGWQRGNRQGVCGKNGVRGPGSVLRTNHSVSVPDL